MDLRVLISSKIFPNRAQPGWAPFNRQQFGALGRLPGVQVVDVLATIPYFPGVGLLEGRSLAAGLTQLPRTDTIEGLPVRHPRTLYLPRVDYGLSGLLHFASLLPLLPRYRGRVDVWLAAWAYPDGCAAVALGKLLGVPVVVKLHGSDINVLSERPGPREALRRFLPQAARVVTVSQALAQKVAALGVREDRIDLVRNGVNTALFRPKDRAAARQALGLVDAPTVLCVSRMEVEKGVLDLLEAFALVRRRVPEARLYLLGNGGAQGACAARAAQPDLQGAVRLTGAVPLEEVSRYLAAADVAVMPSWAEGLPNTVLEALACGRPVVATDVGGVGEVLDRSSADGLGRLVPARQPVPMAEALQAVLARAMAGGWDAEAIASARTCAWQDSAAQLAASLRLAAAEGGAP